MADDDLKLGEEVRMWSPDSKRWLHGRVEAAPPEGIDLKNVQDGKILSVHFGLFVAWIDRPGSATALPNRFVRRGWEGWESWDGCGVWESKART